MSAECIRTAGHGAVRQAAAPLGQPAAWLTARGPWTRRAVLFGAGAVSTLAFAPFFAWPVLFLTFPLLVWSVEAAGHAPRPARAAAVAWWWFAFGYFFTGLFWIGEAFLVEAEIFAWLLPFAVTLLPAGLALFWAAAGAACVRLAPGDGVAPLPAALSRCLTAAGMLGLVEWLRGHILTGFPWNTPGIALTMPLELMQPVAIFGIYGLTLWAVLISTQPLIVFTTIGVRKKEKWLAISACVILPVSIAFLYGSWRLSLPHTPMVPDVRIRIVQPSIPQRDKWIGSRQPDIFATHIDLSRRTPSGTEDGLAGITHVVWPEAAMPFGPLHHPEALAAIGEMLPPGKLLLAGILRRQDDEATGTPRAYNSLAAFGAGGALVALYDKIHLVPFGEYLPFQGVLEAAGLQSLTRQRGGFAIGPSPRPLLHVPGLPPILPLICYEAIFPDAPMVAGEVPGMILVVTNDGWFGDTTGPHQHFHQARLRAVELGVPLVRSANNGISAMIDPEGRILAMVRLNERGSLDSALPAPREQRFSPPLRNYVFWVNIFLFLGTAQGLAQCLRKSVYPSG